MYTSAKHWFGKFVGKQDVVLVHEKRVVELPNGERIVVTESTHCGGASCPRPQLITLQILNTLEPGEVMELVSDNPVTVETIPALAMTQSCEHVMTVRTEDGWHIYLRKS